MFNCNKIIYRGLIDSIPFKEKEFILSRLNEGLPKWNLRKWKMILQR